MDSLKGVISDMRNFFYAGISTLPLTIAGTCLILGLFTANYAMLFFLIAFLILVPITTSVMNLIVDAVFKDGTLFRVPSNTVCSLVTPFMTLDSPANSSKESILFCSNGTAMIAFFFGYMMTNAVKMYMYPAEPGSSETLVSNRKMTTMISMACITLFILMGLYYRWGSSCETWYGFALGTALFSVFGYGWYTILSIKGNNRLSDLFGIANRLMVKSSTIQNESMACFSS